MTYKKNKNQGNSNSAKKKVTSKKEKFKAVVKNKNFIWSMVVAVIIVVIIVIAFAHPFFFAPSSIKPDSYYKISDGDLLPDGHSGIFFLSWLGCPIGATDSWAIYHGINSTTNISGHVELHSALKNDIYSNDITGQPGLLFNGNFTFNYKGNTFTFYPLYMYNETMTGTVNNGTIHGSLASYGLSLINSTYPAKVAAMFNKYATDITYKGHLTTTFIITGPHGTYILNAFMYTPVSGGILGSGSPDPPDWSPNSPSYVMSHLGSSKTITGAASTFMSYVGKAA
ncbi:DUF929 family protein [Ferroplasma sp.]|uniref:DUF929 family protein n=1 Tax=Ferroplasma sp. TaxID=2591003 RepID=UPI00307D68E9